LALYRTIGIVSGALTQVAKKRAQPASPAIGITSAGSAALNSFAFMQGADASPLAIGAAILMGCFLPGFIYGLTRLSAHLAYH
jgi:hypothetical protein